jgi:hypothetical protein
MQCGGQARAPVLHRTRESETVYRRDAYFSALSFVRLSVIVE